MCMLSGIQLYASPGVGCHFLLQGIFPTQGSSPASPALAGRFFFLPLSHLGSPLLPTGYCTQLKVSPLWMTYSAFP